MVQNRQKYQQLLSHWNQPIRRVARVFLWSDWLRDVWILYSVAKSCCPWWWTKYTHRRLQYTQTQILCEERHLAPTHCLVTVITLEADFPFTPTFIYSFLSPEVISLTVCISQHKITIPHFFAQWPHSNSNRLSHTLPISCTFHIRSISYRSPFPVGLLLRVNF